MKVTVNPLVESQPTFECGKLYQSKDKVIVLCTSPNGTAGYPSFEGVTITGKGMWKGGHYSETWNRAAFTEFKGSILLEQNRNQTGDIK